MTATSSRPDDVLALASYNPVVKVLTPAPAMLVAIGSSGATIPAAIGGVGLLALLALGRQSARVNLWLLLGPAIAVGVLTLSFGAWTSLSDGLETALRITAVMLLALVAGLTTDGADLVRSMIQHLKMPYRLGYAGFAAIRFVPRLQNDLDTIRAAHRVRGVASGRGPVAVAQHWSGYAVPLVAGAIRHGDRVSLAMEARAFGAHRTRTERRRVPLRARDAVFGLAALALCLVPLLLPT